MYVSPQLYSGSVFNFYFGNCIPQCSFIRILYCFSSFHITYVFKTMMGFTKYSQLSQGLLNLYKILVKV